jgi:hypothetical protein
MPAGRGRLNWEANSMSSVRTLAVGFVVVAAMLAATGFASAQQAQAPVKVGYTLGAAPYSWLISRVLPTKAR